MKSIRLIFACTMMAINIAAADTDRVSNKAPSRNINDTWMLLTGYGATHPGLGKTREYVETVDAVLRYTRKFKDTGRNWYRGSHELLIELPVSFVINPDTAPIFAINFLASWTLRTWQRFLPYCFAGGGPVYTEADIPGMGSNFNGNYQAGCGIRYQTENGPQFALEYRFHHISNLGLKSPNDPLNSSKFLFGVSLPF